jgi:hypothetical protein
MAPPAHGTPKASEHHEDQADDREDNPNGPQNGNGRDESDYHQDDAEDDHFSSPSNGMTS